LLSKVVLSVPKMGKEQPDKKSCLFAGAMRKTIGLSHYRDEGS